MLGTDLALALDPVRVMKAAGLTPDPWQEKVLRSGFPRQLLCCSRQSGKSTTTAALACHEILFRPGALALIVSPSLRQSGEMFRKILDFYRAIPGAPKHLGESALRLELCNGSRVISLPGSEETVRGFSGVTLLVVDEAARVSDDMYRSARPMLATSTNGRFIGLTTPAGKRGWFFEEWSGTNSWERIRITASDCPRIPRGFLEDEERTLGARWYAQEYFCSFEENEEGVFAYSDIEAALDEGITPLFPEVRQ